MRAVIVHESRGRMRLRLRQKPMSLRQADLLEAWLKSQPWTREAAVHERTGCVIVTYTGNRETVLSAFRAFTWTEAEASASLPCCSTRAMNREFQEKLAGKVLMKGAAALFLPSPLRIARVIWHMIPFLGKGLRCLGRRQVKVELLDALSIGISACRRDFGTAGMVMFLLEIGELLEEWTRKKSVADLAESLSLHVDQVWLKTGAGEVLVPIGQVKPGDLAVVRAGNVIPLDGVVTEGEIAVNQASLTGEPVPVVRRPGGAVYAGTVVEEGAVQEIFSRPASAAARRLVYPAGAPRAESLPGHRLVRVAFNGTQTTDKPLVASLAIQCGVPASILAADTRMVNGQTLGSMLLALPEGEGADRAIEYIQNYPGITYEEVKG